MGADITTGERIEQLAKERGISLRKLATLSGVPYTTIYSAVKRKSDRVDRKAVEKISKALGIRIEEVLSGNQILQDQAEIAYKAFPQVDRLDMIIHGWLHILNAESRLAVLDFVADLISDPNNLNFDPAHKDEYVKEISEMVSWIEPRKNEGNSPETDKAPEEVSPCHPQEE